MTCEPKDIIMTVFKKEFLTQFVDTGAGEVTEYLGCKLIRNTYLK
jgi:hypothetical protein